MDADLLVQVRTADYVPIVTASVTVRNYPPTQTDTDGAARFGIVKLPIHIEVKMDNYIEQAVDLTVNDMGAVVWTDPGSTVIVRRFTISTELSISIPLGRMRPAPVESAKEMDLVGQKAVARAPRGMPANSSMKILEPLQHTWVRDNDTYPYVPGDPKDVPPEGWGNLWCSNFWAATEFTLLRNKNDNVEGGHGWELFNASSRVIKPVLESDFWYVEWGDTTDSPGGGPRYLIGLWRPRSATQYGGEQGGIKVDNPPTGEARDVFIFMSPSTQQALYPPDKWPYRADYPYAAEVEVKMTDKGKVYSNVYQPYVNLPSKYFYTNFLACEILSSKRDALVIFPVHPFGFWEEMGQIYGLSRLVAEALLFEHRQRPLPDLHQDSTSAGKVAVSTSKSTAYKTSFAPPALRRVAIAGYSFGMAVVKRLMRGAIEAESASYSWSRTWEEETKSAYRSSPDKFLAAWREVYDIDGSSNAIGDPKGKGKPPTYSGWARTCLTWQKSGKQVTNVTKDTDSDRIVRTYHSQETMPLVSATGVLEPLLGLKRTKCGPNKTFRDCHGSSGSVVWLSDLVLFRGHPKGWREGDHATDGISPDQPDYWSGKTEARHIAICLICVSHALANSKIRQLKPP